jgi:hypothetical protein
MTIGAHLNRKDQAMAPHKTLPVREKELQLLLSTASGQDELRKLEARYYSVSGKLRPASTSVITYILIHERVQGLIRN